MEKHKGDQKNDIGTSQPTFQARDVHSRNVGRILVGLGLISVISGGIVAVINKTKSKTNTTIELTEQNKNFKYDDRKNPFWDDNEEFFKADYRYQNEAYNINISGKPVNVSIVHDAGLDFYRVCDLDFDTKTVFTGKYKHETQKNPKGKILRSKNGRELLQRVPITKDVKTVNFDRIIGKLSQLNKFKYLTRKEYKDNKIKSFNIKGNFAAKTGMLLPIPLDSNVRQISEHKFGFYCKKAIEEIKNDKHYGKKVKSLVESIGEDELIVIMIAYARSETAEQNKPIGYFELNRWEERYKAFSFTYYHILMIDEGLKARKKLGLTEGQCNHPINASKLFLAFWMEKTKGKPLNYFPLSDDKKLRLAGKKFNGSYEYVPKLKSNYRYVKKLMNSSSQAKKKKV